MFICTSYIDEFRTEEGEEIFFILCDACLVKKKAKVIIACKSLITPHRESKKKYKSRNEWDGKRIIPGSDGTVRQTPGKNGR